MVYEDVQSWKKILNSRKRGWRLFIPAKVDDDPSDVSQKRYRSFGFDEAEQRLNDAKVNDIVSKIRTVADYVS